MVALPCEWVYRAVCSVHRSSQNSEGGDRRRFAALHIVRVAQAELGVDNAGTPVHLPAMLMTIRQLT